MKRSDSLKLFNKLSWKILEHKFRYYEGAKYGLKPIPDDKYDKLEVTYLKLAKALNLPTSASDSVGFPWDKPSARLVANKLAGKKF